MNTPEPSIKDPNVNTKTGMPVEGEQGGKSNLGGQTSNDSKESMVEDVKEVAKATQAKGAGLKESAEEIKKGKERDGAKGAAGAAGREAAGQTVATVADVASGGATAKYHAAISKIVSKSLTKKAIKRQLITYGIVSAIPLVFIVIIISIMAYLIRHPMEALKKAITDPKIREFAVSAGVHIGRDIVFGQGEVLKRYGYVDVNSGVAIAQDKMPAPKPGSLADKLTKVDMEKAIYQTNAKPDCPYTFTYKKVANHDGKQTSVIDKVFDNQGKEVVDGNFVVYYCVIKSMPLYNMMIRTEGSREVNGFGGVALSFASSEELLKGMSVEEVKDYIHDKAYSRLPSQLSETPSSDIEDLDQYIKDVRKALEEGEDPYLVDSDFKFQEGFDTDDKKTIVTMCAFSKNYLTPENLRKAIFSKYNTGQRSGVRSTTLASTRYLGFMTNAETGPTLRQLENWSASTAYHQNVYGSMEGEKVNPESLGNTSYGLGFERTLSIMYDTFENCEKLNFGRGPEGRKGLFGFIQDPQNENTLSKIRRSYENLRAGIVEESNGRFVDPNDFGLKELMIGMIRTNAGSAVSGMEPGAWNFNSQSQGFRVLSNQYMMRLGGRFLDSKEMYELNKLAENTRREVEEKNGLAYRLFGNDNVRSIANIIQSEYPRTPNELNRVGQEYIAKITNPIKTIANLHSSLGYIATGKINQAFAADVVGDTYMRIDTIGMPLNMTDGVDMIANSDYIQNMLEKGTNKQKQILGYFDKCSKSNIPSRALFAPLRHIDQGSGESAGTVQYDRFGYPYYPAMADKIEHPLGDKTSELRPEKREFIACDIYMRAGMRTSKDRYKQLFELGNENIDIEKLADQYRLFLFANKLVDMMVQLSSTEEDSSIYANPSGGQNSAPVGPVRKGEDTSNFPTPAGTTEVAIEQVYGPGRVPSFKIKLVQLDGFKVRVNASIGAQAKQMFDAAKLAGINLDGGGFRTYDEQVQLRIANCNGDKETKPAGSCNPPTAKPGLSNHEEGLAIDMTQDGQTLRSYQSGFAWLQQNASKYGFKNLPSESWHWSVDGS